MISPTSTSHSPSVSAQTEGEHPMARSYPRDAVSTEPAMQDAIARATHCDMVSTGLMWRQIQTAIKLDPTAPIESLSNRNIRILRDKVGRLAPQELRFYTSMMAQPWFLTHFTSSKNFKNKILRPHHEIVLKSFTQRQRESPAVFVHTNAAACDLEELGGGDFVYLCVELGKHLKKTSTRSKRDGSGFTVIRTPLEQQATRCAMSYHGDIFDGLRVASRLPLPRGERATLNRHLSRFENEPLNDDNGFARTVFYGPENIKDATTLQVILDLRHVSEAPRREILARKTSTDLNEVLSSMSRTQVMVPRAFSTKEFNLYQLDPNSGN